MDINCEDKEEILRQISSFIVPRKRHPNEFSRREVIWGKARRGGTSLIVPTDGYKYYPDSKSYKIEHRSKIFKFSEEKSNLEQEAFFYNLIYGKKDEKGNLCNPRAIKRLSFGYYYIIIPKFPGMDLFDCVSKVHLEGYRKKIIQNCLEMVKIIHDKQCIHCDLKLENFIIDDKTLDVKAIDFGFMVKIEDAKQGRVKGFTPYHVAPEIWNELLYKQRNLPNYGKLTIPFDHFPINPYDTKADIYSLGIMIAEIFLPMGFESYLVSKKHIDNPSSFYSYDHYGKYLPKFIVETNEIPTEVKILLLKMIYSNPKMRPNIDQVIEEFKKVTSNLSF